jgi:hypothetical protein
MANNYLQFSFQLDGSEWTPEACAYLAGKIDKLHEDLENGQFVCSYQIEPTGIWLYGEESGDPDMLAKLIQKTMRKFKMKRAIAFTWAETCSKMRTDEFCGGGVCVKPRSMLWMSGGMVHPAAQKFNQKLDQKEESES